SALARAETLAAVVPLPEALVRYQDSACVLDGTTPPIAHARRAGLLALALADGSAWWLVPASMTGVTLVAAAADLGLRGAPPAASRARSFAVDAAIGVTLESMRIHGGYGYTTEFAVERYYRDAAALLSAPARVTG